MKRIFPLFALTVFILTISSCGLYRDSGYKQISYYQDMNHAGVTEAIANFQPLKIQTGDLLGINLSTLSPEGSAVFNTNINRVNGNGLDASATNPIYGFRVDGSGQVLLPLLGSMKVAGMTTDELAKSLTVKLQDYFKSPIVNVRILNFKISVLGDVLRPDSYTIQNEHININEALSLAGDLNITAIRQIFLIREINGKREYIPIDLNSKRLFDSPYYYLKNHDVLYITPNRTKISNNNTAGFQRVSLIISALSVAALILVSRKNF